MKKIGEYTDKAPKLSETGYVTYCLWVDKEGTLYVQLLKQDGPGTFSKLAFSVPEYQSLSSKSLSSPRKGFNVETSVMETDSDNNTVGLLKAALTHLLKKKA